MKPRLSIILSFNLITGCASTSNAVNITWTKIPLEQMQQYCPNAKADAMACAVWDAQNKTWCRIYTPQESDYSKVLVSSPRLRSMSIEYKEFLLLGHELRHCFDGQFHK